MLGLSLGLSALSMTAMYWFFDPANTTRAYLGTDTRMAGILAGAALATLISPSQSFSLRSTRALDAFGALSIAGLGVAWFELSGTSSFLYRGGFWLTELGALVLIACAVAGEQSLVARALSLRPFRLLGAISYGVYLWHWPVNVFLSPERVHMHGLGLQVLHFSLTFAIALASYRFLEQPIRRHGVPFNRPLFIVPAALALSVFLVVRATYARPTHNSLSAMLARIPLPIPETITFRVMVFGDSTANSLGWGLRSLRERGADVQLMGKDGCNMLADQCEGPHWVEHVREQHPNVSIVYLAGAFLHGFSVKGVWHTACRADWDQKFERVLSLRLRELEGEAGLVFTSTIPYPVGRYDAPEFRDEVDCINTSIRKTVDAVPGVQLIDVGARLCPGGVCQQDVGGDEPVRPDGVHFSIDSAQDLSRWVYEEIRR